MDVTSCLKHLAKYWDVYWFVAEEPRTKAEIKEYLMEECYKAESTARDSGYHGACRYQYHHEHLRRSTPGYEKEVVDENGRQDYN